MQQQLERQWRRARAYEANGNPLAAKAVYESILQKDVTQVFAWLRLSELEESADHYRNSHGYAMQAAAATQRHSAWKDLSYVTLRLLAFDEREAVGNLIMNADWSDPNVLTQSAVLSQHLWLTDHYETALRLIDEASQRVKPSHLLSYSRANALRYCGQMEKATEEFERCLQLVPNYPYAHWSLAYHQKASPPRSRIDRVRKAKAFFPDNSSERAHLCYALFKELDDVGDVDQAWSALQEGARIMRKRIHYDSAAELNRLEALQQLTSPDFFQGAGSGEEGRVPVFIVGMPRTGTTLLERILSNHAEVVTAGELNDFARALSQATDHFFTSLTTEDAMHRFDSIDFTMVGGDYLRRTNSRAGGHPYLIDKNPMNFFNAGFIRKALPQCKIVCMARNPMDSCFSNLKELFAGDAYAYSYDLIELADHYLGFERLRTHWQQVMPDSVHMVNYEDLVADPIAVARRAAEFCGIEFDPVSVDIAANPSPVSTASSSQVRQPIHSKNLNAWELYAEYLHPLQDRLDAASRP